MLLIWLNENTLADIDHSFPFFKNITRKQGMNKRNSKITLIY